MAGLSTEGSAFLGRVKGGLGKGASSPNPWMVRWGAEWKRNRFNPAVQREAACSQRQKRAKGGTAATERSVAAGMSVA